MSDKNKTVPLSAITNTIPQHLYDVEPFQRRDDTATSPYGDVGPGSSQKAWTAMDEEIHDRLPGLEHQMEKNVYGPGRGVRDLLTKGIPGDVGRMMRFFGGNQGEPDPWGKESFVGSWRDMVLNNPMTLIPMPGALRNPAVSQGPLPPMKQAVPAVPGLPAPKLGLPMPKQPRLTNKLGYSTPAKQRAAKEMMGSWDNYLKRLNPEPQVSTPATVNPLIDAARKKLRDKASKASELLNREPFNLSDLYDPTYFPRSMTGGSFGPPTQYISPVHPRGVPLDLKGMSDKVMFGDVKGRATFEDVPTPDKVDRDWLINDARKRRQAEVDKVDELLGRGPSGYYFLSEALKGPPRPPPSPSPGKGYNQQRPFGPGETSRPFNPFEWSSDNPMWWGERGK